MTTERLTLCRREAAKLRASSAAERNLALETAATLLLARRNEITAANRADLDALPADATPAFRDRLTIDDKRLDLMAESLRQVAALADPLGEEVDRRTLNNGLDVRRVRSPLGVIFLIYESRPNVATEAFSLALKSGNIIILRGGKESKRTTESLYAILGEALETSGLSRGAFWGISDPDRKLVEFLLQQNKLIDIVIPRGGDALIEYVVRNSKIPIIKNDRGLCHVYVHEDADLEMAAAIVVNSKTQRPGVCNAMETLLVHAGVREKFLPLLYARLSGVEWFVDEASSSALAGKTKVRPAVEKSWDTEYLDLKMNCRVVGSLDEALRHIEAHGSGHSEAIVTASEKAARRFQAEVDAAAVYWNASTRFTDGFELGLGGEIGISTQKLHVRGPVGLRELTSVRWVIDGDGQVRK